VKEDGSLSYSGRMNRYFANNEGIEFNAGIIETAVAKRDGIEGCAVVPEYDKKIYDTIPVLYVKTCTLSRNSLDIVREALLETFSDQEQFDVSQLPAKCVITGDIPYNDTGKVDINAITKGYVSGDVYSVQGVCKNGKLENIVFKLTERGEGGMGCDQLFC
jgi:hypothetical protein